MTTTPLPGTAETAVMIIHELNLRTRDEHALTEPAELAQILASLTAAAAGLPQLLGQLHRWLTHQHAHHHIHAVGDLTTDQLLEAIGSDLSRAGRIAHDLTAILDIVHQHTTDLSTQPVAKDRSTAHQGVSFHP